MSCIKRTAGGGGGCVQNRVNIVAKTYQKPFMSHKKQKTRASYSSSSVKYSLRTHLTLIPHHAASKLLVPMCVFFTN